MQIGRAGMGYRRRFDFGVREAKERHALRRPGVTLSEPRKHAVLTLV